VGDSAAANTRALNGGVQVWLRWAAGLTLPALLAGIVWLATEVSSLRATDREHAIYIQTLQDGRSDIRDMVEATHGLTVHIEKFAVSLSHMADAVKQLQADGRERDQRASPPAPPER